MNDGRIVPTEQDDFELKDDVIGPTVYTVTAQFIKPALAEAGAHSWALMLHPCGLPCDLFVTHAWQEGIFEFVDKVVDSWPREARNAYCCMLSNPQNGDVGAMLRTPTESPFAQALRAARVMLVVPNRKESIYCRLWCAYEAFLAYKMGKVIYTALPRVPRLASRALVPLLFTPLGYFAGILHGWLLHPRSRDMIKTFIVCFYVMHFTSGAAARFGTGRFLRLVSVIAACIGGMFLHWGIDFQLSGELLSDQARAVHLMGTWVEMCYLSSAWLSIFACLAEADRLWAMQADEQRKQLLHEFTGNLQHATCSMPGDARRIMGELEASGEVESTNSAVQILIHATMYTNNLRRAHEAGVRIDFAGHYRTSTVFVAWGVWLMFAVHTASWWRDRLGLFHMLWPHVGLCFFWPVLWYFASVDVRPFAGDALFRNSQLLMLIQGFRICLRLRGASTESRAAVFGLCLLNAQLLCPLGFLGFCGIGRVAALPVVGPSLVWFCRIPHQ